MGKRKRGSRQATIWIATNDLPTTTAHPFYERLNRILDKAGFDVHVPPGRADAGSPRPVQDIDSAIEVCDIGPELEA